MEIGFDTMRPFTHFLPTTLVFGEGTAARFRELLPPSSGTLMFVTGEKSAEISGALDILTRQTEDLSVVRFTGVEENPGFATLARGAQVARENKVDLVVGIGGGSSMDAAKGIAVTATSRSEMKDHMSGLELTRDPLPVVCIPTTSGSGSETTPYAVFSDRQSLDKGGFSHPKIYPRFSIVDPGFTYTMPRTVRINTGVDALTHGLEAYLSLKSSPLSDLLALQAIEGVLSALPAAAGGARPAMQRMSYHAMVAGMAIAQAGTIFLHALGYPLTAVHQIPHGRANAIMLPAFLRFMRKRSAAAGKLAKIEGIMAKAGGCERFLQDLGIATRLSEYKIRADEIEGFARKTIGKANLKITPAEVTESTICRVYRDAL